MSTLKNIYNIVYFYKCTHKRKKSVNCVPSTWISFDSENQELITKFMPPPYTKKKYNTLNELVKDNKTPLKKWPQYPIKILESAETYTEALLKMAKLIEKNFNCTTNYYTPYVEDENSKGESLTSINKLNGELSKDTEFLSDDNDSNIGNNVYIFNKKSVVLNGSKKSSSDMSTATNTSDPSSSNKPKIIEDVILKNTISISDNPISSTNYLERILTELQDLKYNQELMKNELQAIKINFEQYINKNIGKNVPIHWTQGNHIGLLKKKKNTITKFIIKK